MADAASLNTYPHMARAGISKRLTCKLKTARADGLYSLIGRRAFHHSVPSTDIPVIKPACMPPSVSGDRGDAKAEQAHRRPSVHPASIRPPIEHRDRMPRFC